MARRSGKTQAYKDIAGGAKIQRDKASSGISKAYYSRMNKAYSKAANRSETKQTKLQQKRDSYNQKVSSKMRDSGKEYADKYISKIGSTPVKQTEKNARKGYNYVLQIASNNNGYMLKKVISNVRNKDDMIVVNGQARLRKNVSA